MTGTMEDFVWHWRLAPHLRGQTFFAPNLSVGGGGQMVTYEGLFEFVLVIVSIIGLVIQIIKK